MRTKKTFTILLLLILLNIAVRIPVTPHEIGHDSFYIHWMAQSIIEEGTALWLVHPASVFGLYPYSYPSFVPFLLSIFSNIMGLEIETIILMTSISFGVIGVLFAYMLGKEFSGNELVAYLTAFCFSLSPIFISFTSWTTSARHLFVLLLPLILFLVLRYERTKDNRYLFLTLLFLLVEASVHRMFFLIVLFLVPAYIFTKLYFHFKFKFRESRIIQNVDKRLCWLILIVFFVFFLLQFSNFEFFRTNQYTYRTGLFFTAGSIEDWMMGTLSKPILFLNMCIDYASNSGILFFFLPITLVLWLNKIKNREYKFEELFFVMSLLLGSFFLMNGYYVTMFYLPIFSLLSGIGLVKSTDFLKNKKVGNYLFVSILIVSLIFSCFMIYHWRSNITEEQKVWMQDNTFHAAKFIDRNSILGDSVMTSNALLKRRIISNSYVSVFPLYGPQLLVYDYIDKDKLNAKFQIVPSPNTDYFWVIDAPMHTRGDWGRLIGLNIDSTSARDIINKYDLKYVIENKESNYISKYPHWIFYKDLYESKDKIYDNELEFIFLLPSD